jgi:hypothetical protein
MQCPLQATVDSSNTISLFEYKNLAMEDYEEVISSVSHNNIFTSPAVLLQGYLAVYSQKTQLGCERYNTGSILPETLVRESPNISTSQ